MNGIIVAVSFLIVVAGIFASRSHIFTKNDIKGEHDETGQEETPSVTAEPTISPENPASTTKPARKPDTPTPTQQSSPVQHTDSSSSIDLFRYPNASVTESSETMLKLTTQDPPETVTHWYKKTITDNGMNTRSFVATSTNGEVLNKLAAAGNNMNVSVEITKANSDQTVHITVSLTR